MNLKKLLQSTVAVAVLGASLAATGSASAGADCYGYVTVQPGDTLESIATMCGTTVEAIRAANPGLGASVQVGQMLNMPAEYPEAPAYDTLQTAGSTYVVQWGETLADIAARTGTSIEALLAANRQIAYGGSIYAGQVINLPVSGGVGSLPYYPPAYFQSWNYPYTAHPNVYYPPAPPSAQLRGLKVTYKHGLIVRAGPGRYFREIAGPYVSAVRNSTWSYIKNTATVDREGFVWVQVLLPRVVDGRSTGWIVVKDGLGNYYTRPNIDP